MPHSYRFRPVLDGGLPCQTLRRHPRTCRRGRPCPGCGGPVVGIRRGAASSVRDGKRNGRTSRCSAWRTTGQTFVGLVSVGSYGPGLEAIRTEPGAIPIYLWDSGPTYGGHGLRSETPRQLAVLLHGQPVQEYPGESFSRNSGRYNYLIGGSRTAPAWLFASRLLSQSLQCLATIEKRHMFVPPGRRMPVRTRLTAPAASDPAHRAARRRTG